MTETTEATRQDLITSIEARADHLPEWNGFTLDDALQMYTDMESAKERIEQAKDALDTFMLRWMPANNVTRLVSGTRERYITDKKKEKCRSIEKAVEALMVAVGGDYQAFCHCLSVNGIKPGEAKKVLGREKFDELWETIIEKDLESKPIKVLKQIDTRFIK